jgi:hypothetical protein
MAVSHPGVRGNHLAAVDCEAVDLKTVVGVAAILPNTGKELKHEVQVGTSRLSGCTGVVNSA